MPRRVLLVVLALALLSAACGDGDAGGGAPDGGAADAGQDRGPTVVATTTILGDITRAIVGDAGTVEVLMAPGQDPHAYRPSAKQAALIRDADLVVANGLDLEEPLLDLLEAAEEDGVEVLRVAEEVDPLAFGEDEESHADEEPHGQEHDHEGLDPHVWLDPVRMADAAQLVAERLDQVSSASPEPAWQERGEAVAEDILAAHEDVQATLAPIPEGCRTLVTDHESFGYFAQRYGFEVVGTVIPGTSSQAEPSARGFAELVDTVRETGVPAIITDTTSSTRLADTLASEVGRDVEIVSLHTESLGEPGSGAESYTDLLRENARRLAEALASC